MWPFSSSKKSSLIIALHDGSSWRARNFHFHHGQWHAEGAIEAPSRNGKKLPKPVLEFASRADSRRLRILLTGDLHSVGMELPEDAENEEVHTALVYEAASEIGIEAHMLRLAAVRADRFQMGADSNQILTAGFDVKTIEGFAHDCEKAGIEFDGIGSLEMTVLSRHARLDEEMRLLFLRRQTGVYVVPAFDNTPFMLSTVPFGCDEEANETAKERAERAAKRCSAQGSLPLRVVCCEPLSEERKHELKNLLKAEERLEFHYLSEVEEEVLQHVAWVEVGTTEAGCAMIGPPPKPRDPHRAGTWICLMIILLTSFYVGGRWHSFKLQFDHAQKRQTAWKELVAAREKEKAGYKSLNASYNNVLGKLKLLKGIAPLPESLLPILNTLAQDTPKYCRITEIEQIEDEEGNSVVFVVRGVTRWQEGLRKLDRAFSRRGLLREFSSEIASNNGEQKFEFKVRLGEQSK